ncbi:NfeD family protein [Desulfococcus sp.]|uniref:NfeD family protein n=1 Tax=Desulfococcus sp. TaxID=2025834 RepID=UPI00359350A9
MDILKDPVIIWFLIGLFCVIAEFFAPGVIIVFFGAGAWVVALLCLGSEISTAQQITVFTVVSIGALVLLRKRFNPPADSGPDIDEFIGRTAVVLEPMRRGRPGRVTFKGAAWKAETTSDEWLETGRSVSIVARESILLFVESIPEQESMRK